MHSHIQPLVAPSEHLDHALATIKQAALDFVTPDPHLRARGEATFLALRHSDRAIQYACYALQHHDQDPLVHFQSLNAILYALPAIPLHSTEPDAQIASLAQLRDFTLQLAISRGEHAAQCQSLPAANSSSWPQYLRARAHQTAIAVEKRLLGLELAHCAHSNDANAAQHVVHGHVALLTSQLSALLSLPSPWPSSNNPVESATALARLAAGLGLVKALVDEFVLTPASEALAALSDPKDRGKAKAVEPGTPIGLSVLEHRWCKAVVQNHVLPDLMGRSFQLLYGIISADADKTAAWRMELFPQAVSAIEKLLGWTFLLSDSFASFGSNASPDQLDGAEDYSADSDSSSSSGGRQYIQTRRLPSHFIDVIMPVDIVTLLATAYRFALDASASVQNRDLSFSVHRLRQCLLLAASYIPGEPATTQIHSDLVVQRVAHLSLTLQSLVRDECGNPTSALLSARGNAMLFLAQAFQAVISANPVRQLAEALKASGDGTSNASGTMAFLGSLSHLGKSIFELAFYRPRDTDEEDDLAVLAEDTTDTLLSCWQVLRSALYRELEEDRGGETAGAVTGGGQQQQQPSASQLQILWQAVHGSIRDEVFNPYVTGRLQAARMPSDAGADGGDASEHGEAAAKDRDVYSDQLITIAGLGRLSALDNLRTLHQLAEPLCQMLAAVAEGRVGAAAGQPPVSPQQLETAWEQTHWLLLMAGHLIADEAKGETPEVPSSIVTAAASAGGGASSQEDPAVALIIELGLNLVQMLSSHGARSAQATSPQVTETLLWFVGRWTSTYLLIDDHSGFPTNASIQRAFSGDAGRKVLAFLLQRLRENLELWMSDSDVLSQLASLLSSFTRSSGIMLHLLQLPEMETLVSEIVSNLDALPANTHGPLVSAVVSCIYSGVSYVVGGQETRRTAESYFSQITASIETRFGSLVQRPDFATIAQRSDVIAAVQTSLDMLNGLASSVQPNSADAVYAFLSCFFPVLSHLVRVYETRAEVSLSIVKVLRTLAVALELDFGAEPYMVAGLNGVTWSVLEALKGKTKHALMQSDGGSPMEDEVPYEGLCLAMELLNELSGSARASNDESGGDATTTTTTDDTTTFSPTRTADVTIFGFESLVVLLDSEPLGVPRVRRALGKLVDNMLSLFSERILSLSLSPGSAILKNVMMALLLVLKQDESDLILTSLEAMTPFSRNIVKMLHRHPTPAVISEGVIFGSLDSLITTLLRLLLLDPLDNSLIDTVLSSLRSLIMARTDAPSSLGEFYKVLESFIQSVPLSPSTTMTTINNTDESTRRHILSQIVQRLVEDSLESLRSVIQHQEIPWLVQGQVQLASERMWFARDKEVGMAFVQRWKEQVRRCRGRIRVR